MTKVLLISHRDFVETRTRFEGALFHNLAQHVDLSFADWDEGGATEYVERYRSLAGGERTSSFDVCIMFVRFRILRNVPALQWGGFEGLRLWLEPDAWGGFYEKSPFHGLYEPVYRRHRFDVMVSSGKEVTRRLREAGVNAYWIPKGYDREVFFDLGKERSGTCTFGTMWPSRRALLNHLNKAGLEIVDVSGPYTSLNERLNQFAGGLVCNIASSIPLGRLGRILNRRWPGFTHMSRGIEPMAKTFEVAGAGCAPIIDEMDELNELGFVSGHTCFTYRDFTDAEEVLRTTWDGELREIGSRAAGLVQARHTWAHRAEQLADLINRE